MTKIEYYEKGYAKIGFDLGFITPTVHEYYSRYKIYLKAKEQGNGHMESISITGKLTRSSEATVRRAIDFFEQLPKRVYTKRKIAYWDGKKST